MQYVSAVHIQSYFSLPTDLASHLKDWPEFVSGDGYSVHLESGSTSEAVDVGFVEQADDEAAYVFVRATKGQELFERTVGAVTYALAEHSDYLQVYRWDPTD